MKFSWRWLVVLLILGLAIGVRFYQLGKIPIEINRDEASLGYTAFSILKTGREEHGLAWPINIESFGDWKLPGYVYTLIPFVKIFGLNAWAVKLPSSLAGVGVVILGWIIAWQIGGAWVGEKRRFWLATTVALLLAISPWDIHLSHMAYEAHLAMLMMLSAVAIFLAVMEMKKSRWWLVLSTMLFGLTLFTYHSYQVFTPLLAIGLGFFYWPEVKKLWQKSRPIFITCLVVAGFFSLALVSTSIKANQVKFSGLSIFDKDAYLPLLEVNRGYFDDRNSLAAKIHDNTPTLFLNQVQHNLADIFSAKFLFFEGGGHGSHDIPGTGKFYPIEFLFFIAGGYLTLTFWQQKKLHRTQKLLIWWLLIAIVAPGITFQAAHTIRFSPVLFALTFLSGLGLFYLINQPGKIFKFVVAPIFALILTYSFIYFCLTYFLVTPKRDINTQNWEMPRLLELINERQDQYQTIRMPGPTWSPYIYFLFYNQVDPKTAFKTLEYFPIDNEGFRYAKKLGKIDFSPITWDESQDANTLYVIKRNEVPGDKLESGNYQLEYSLTNPYAKDEWLLISHP